MATVRDLCLEGHTVIVAIHQPRSSIYALFDDLLLLSDGRVSLYYRNSLVVVVVAVDDGDLTSAQFVSSAKVMWKLIPVGAARDVQATSVRWSSVFRTTSSHRQQKTTTKTSTATKSAAATSTATAPGAALYAYNQKPTTSTTTAATARSTRLRICNAKL